MQKNYLRFVLSVSVLLQSCASFGMGKKCPCEEIKLPPVPIVEHCIANADSTCFYFDNDGVIHRVPVVNKVCRQADEDAAIFNWIKWVEANAK